jgi:hypothetical protein
MELYTININGKKYKQYKTFEEALDNMKKIIESEPNSNIKIYSEEFCEYECGSDTSCKIHIVCDYENSTIKKYL